MKFIGCDPGPSNCAIVIIEPLFEIDMTGAEVVYHFFDSYKIIYSETITLEETNSGIPGITSTLVNHLNRLDKKYIIKLAAVEDQGIKQGPVVLPINVQNNSIQSAFYAFFYGCEMGTYHVIPSTWKEFHHCRGISKSVLSYQNNGLLQNVVNTNLLTTVHEWDAAMIAISKWFEIDKNI
jgi:hypothetical protein